MKKIRSKSKKGFTLVELIVVLVILAILAAMLVPALTGYIDEARKKKDYSAASEVLTAAQAIVAEYYGSDTTPTVAEATTYVNGHADRIKALTGLNTEITTDPSVTSMTATYVINGMTVGINGNTYTWDGSQWT